MHLTFYPTNLAQNVRYGRNFHKNIAIYFKLHVTIMAMDMLQQVGFPPDYLTSLSMYMVLLPRELGPKVLTFYKSSRLPTEDSLPREGSLF